MTIEDILFRFKNYIPLNIDIDEDLIKEQEGLLEQKIVHSNEIRYWKRKYNKVRRENSRLRKELIKTIPEWSNVLYLESFEPLKSIIVDGYGNIIYRDGIDG